MCLAIPGQVIEFLGGDEAALLRMAWVHFGGIQKEVSLVYLPQAQVGDYVIVHVGFAISLLDQAEAARVLDALEQVGLLESPDGEG